MCATYNLRKLQNSWSISIDIVFYKALLGQPTNLLYIKLKSVKNNNHHNHNCSVPTQKNNVFLSFFFLQLLNFHQDRILFIRWTRVVFLKKTYWTDRKRRIFFGNHTNLLRAPSLTDQPCQEGRQVKKASFFFPPSAIFGPRGKGRGRGKADGKKAEMKESASRPGYPIWVKEAQRGNSIQKAALRRCRRRRRHHQKHRRRESSGARARAPLPSLAGARSIEN